MDKNMKVSIIIPAYNAALTIEDAVQSTMSQTYDNFEVIIVDDASTDNTLTIAAAASAKAANFKYLWVSRNEGTAWARNFGAEHATGDALLFLDADDMITHDYLRMTVPELENPAV